MVDLLMLHYCSLLLNKPFCVVAIEKYFHRHEREGGEALQLVLPQWGA